MSARARFFSIPGIGLFAGLLATSAHAQSAAVSNVAVMEVAGGTRLVVETDRPVAGATAFFLSSPDRFVVDVPSAQWRAAGQGAGGGVALRRRYANRPDGSARVVLDLQRPVRLVGRRTGLGGRRLIFDLADAAPARPR